MNRHHFLQRARRPHRVTLRHFALLGGAAISLAACTTAPAPDQPTWHATGAASVSTPAPTPATAETGSARPTTGIDAYAPFSPCLVSDEAVGAALGLDIERHYGQNFGYEDEYFCTYQTKAGTVLEVYFFPPVEHRRMGIGVTQADQENRPAPEEQPIAVEGATDVHGYLAFPGIDVRFETDQAFVLLASRASSDREGLDKTVVVANLITAALATQATS